MTETTLPGIAAARGRPHGRGPSPTAPLHAVPHGDRTRTALCGARVGGTPRPWTRGGSETCPDCRALLARPVSRSA